MDQIAKTADYAAGSLTEIVADLVHRYARLVRERRGIECRNLFCDDAYYEIRQADPLGGPGDSTLRTRLDGAAAIADYVDASSKGGVRLFPTIFNLMVEPGPASARSNCLMVSRTIPHGHEVFGIYDDEYVLKDGIWLFASRTYTICDAPWMRGANP